ncbi:MAG: beta-ketoacyl-[acyl-carrier-protein] synthase family protein [Candidatus Omnitrophica bacterium]|nr:beta-ketoacyl-[acyl-carrier-protein] synthase family protein [Candidatus Omnitrophota bacterium]
MRKKRIVITGIGVVSPVGLGKEAFWHNLWEGKPGFGPISLFDTSDLKVKVAGEASGFNPQEILGKRGLIDLDRATTLLLSAAKFCLQDSQIDLANINSPTTGICIGTTFGSLNSLSEFDEQSLQEGPNFVNASRFPNTVINSPASRAAIRYGIKGPNTTVSTGFCASLDALEHAVDTINAGRAERIIAGGLEEMCIQTFLGFYRLGYLSGLKNNYEPTSCPFDKRRDGIIFSEGSGVFLVEELDAALNRNAHIYAEVLGIGSDFDPFRLHKFNPKARGMIEAMQFALEDAGIDTGKIDCIFANANSTPDGDYVEARAIREVFQKQADEVPVTAVKSITGESFSAGGSFALAAALGTLETGLIPPIVNFEQADAASRLNFVSDSARMDNVDKIMINAFGPNGANSSVVIGRYY